RGARAAGPARRRERHRSHDHGGASQSGPVNLGFTAPQRVCGWVGLPAPVPRSQIPNFGIARPEPGHWYAFGDRGHAARPSALLSTARRDRKSTRLNSSHRTISYAVFCLKKKTKLASTLPIARVSIK